MAADGGAVNGFASGAVEEPVRTAPDAPSRRFDTKLTPTVTTTPSATSSSQTGHRGRRRSGERAGRSTAVEP